MKSCYVGGLCLAVALSPFAVRAAAQAPAAGQQQQAPAQPAILQLLLTTGRSTVLTTDFDVTRLAITNPAVADATVIQPREVLIDGKAPGTVSMILWGGDRRVQYDVVVDPGVNA